MLVVPFLWEFVLWESHPKRMSLHSVVVLVVVPLIVSNGVQREYVLGGIS